MQKTKRSAVVGAATIALVGGGIAFAAWTSTGTGTGSATAGDAAVLGVAQDAAVGGLFPTGTKDVSITVTNTNSYPIKVSSLVPGAVSVDSGHAGCTSPAVTFSSLTALTDRVAAGGTKTYTVNAAMGADSSNGCQGATFSTPYTATGASTS